MESLFYAIIIITIIVRTSKTIMGYKKKYSELRKKLSEITVKDTPDMNNDDFFFLVFISFNTLRLILFELFENIQAFWFLYKFNRAQKKKTNFKITWIFRR